MTVGLGTGEDFVFHAKALWAIHFPALTVSPESSVPDAPLAVTAKPRTPRPSHWDDLHTSSQLLTILTPTPL